MTPGISSASRALAVLGKIRDTYARRFVFIHINKTGGSSVERALGLTFEHRTAREKIAQMGERAWRRKFSFSIVRNPWDRVASHYFYRVKTDQTGLGSGRISFGEWVARAYGERDPALHDKPQMFLPQADWVTDESGQVVVDFIGRFENLSADFETICGKIGRRADLPHVKSSGKGDYRQYYTDAEVEVVAQYFARDLKLFGYSFDPDV